MGYKQRQESVKGSTSTRSNPVKHLEDHVVNRAALLATSKALQAKLSSEPKIAVLL